MSLGQHSAILLADGTVKASGNNSLGQLGLGDTTQRNSPVAITAVTGVKQIALGTNFTVLLKSDGTASACGANTDGQLGRGSTSTSANNLAALTGVADAVQVDCGEAHAAILMSDGTVKVCGYNVSGQLGLGDATTRSTATKIAGLADVKQVACGASHTLFLMKDGTVKACGLNSTGQLGMGNTTQLNVPTTIPNLSGVKQIAAGNSWSVFVLLDGTVKTCGDNSRGQLGLGDTTQRNSPTAVPDLDMVKHAACGGNHTVFLLDDGSVMGCGYNNRGQLGTGNTTQATSPVATGFTSAVHVACGYDFTTVVLASGGAKSSGGNSLGQLGVGDVNNRSTPTSVSGVSGAKLTWSAAVAIIRLTGTAEVILAPINTVGRSGIAKVEAVDSSVLANSALIVKYAVSMDSVTWYSRVGGNWVQCTNILTQGMDKATLEAVTPAQWAQVFTPGQLVIKAVLSSSSADATPYIDEIRVYFPESYSTGNYYVVTGDAMQLDTLDWRHCNSCRITQTEPAGTGVRYAFSSDKRTTWNVFRGGQWSEITLNQLLSLGMTKAEVEALGVADWDGFIEAKLDVALLLVSTNPDTTPSVSQITFNYEALPSGLVSQSINIPVPAKGFRNTLQVDNTYKLFIAEGIGFDDATMDYNFYTTPDRIIMRALDMGALVGGATSGVSVVEIINGYDENFSVTLQAMQNDVYAKIGDNYGLLNDAERDEHKTKVEISLKGGDEFTPVYPLTFDLDAGARRNIFIRITPTIVTDGFTSFRLFASARPR